MEERQRLLETKAAQFGDVQNWGENKLTVNHHLCLPSSNVTTLVGGAM